MGQGQHLQPLENLQHVPEQLQHSANQKRKKVYSMKATPNRKRSLRALALLLSLAMLLTLFAACSVQRHPQEDTQPPAPPASQHGTPVPRQSAPKSLTKAAMKDPTPSTARLVQPKPAWDGSFNPDEGKPELSDTAYQTLYRTVINNPEALPVGTVILNDAVACKQDLLWYMPQIVAYAEACAERRPDVEADFRKLADEAKMLCLPAQMDTVTVPDDLTEVDLFSRMACLLAKAACSDYFVAGEEYIAAYECESINREREGDYPVDPSLMPWIRAAARCAYLSNELYTLSAFPLHGVEMDFLSYLTEAECQTAQAKPDTAAGAHPAV